MTIQVLFPTSVYTAPLERSGSRGLNRRLLQEARQLREDDRAGRRWSAKNYPGGYTSYGSAHRLQRNSPTFAELERKLRRHVAAFAASLDWDLEGRELSMTDCWVNIMSRHAVHGLHLHPLSSLSGTYYVQVPSRIAGDQVRGPASRPVHGGAAAQGGRAGRATRPGSPCPRGRAARLVRELAAARGRAESGGRANASASASTTTGFSRVAALDW